METILSRSIANTRLRDFYDLRILYDTVDIDYEKLKSALFATSKKRNTFNMLESVKEILLQIETDNGMQDLWSNYQRKYDYAKEYSWNDVIHTIKILFSKIDLLN